MEEIGYIEFAAYSDKGAVRSNNEDNQYCSFVQAVNEESGDSFSACDRHRYDGKEVTLAAVFDGMGGVEGGEMASLAAAREMPALLKALCARTGLGTEGDSAGAGHDGEETSAQGAPVQAFFDAKKRMEEKIRELSGNAVQDGPGTTCCGFWEQGGMVHPFWIGDSRMYLFRYWKLILLTKDHTIAQEKIDQGLISAKEAMTIRSWHYVTAYIGDGQEFFGFGKDFSLQAGDKILLCTDGVSDKVKADELAVNLLLPTDKFMDWLKEATSEGSKDNVTALLFDYHSENVLQEVGSKLEKKLKKMIHG